MIKLFHNNLKKFPGVCAFLPWLAFWSQGGSALPDKSSLLIGIGPENGDCGKISKSFRAVVAKSNSTRAKGLGGRSTPLASDEAMLFLFDRPMHASFWMRDTLIPLQIAYIDKRGFISETIEMRVEDDPAHPVRQYPSREEVVAALEVPPRSLSGTPRPQALCISTLKRH